VGLYALALAIVSIGALLTYLGFSQMAITRRQLATWIPVEGTVIGLVARYPSRRGPLYAPTYRYAVLGSEHVTTADTAASPPDYAVGDTIRLVVNPVKTGESAVIDRNTALNSYGLLALGLGAAWLGLLLGWLKASGRAG